TSARLFTKCRFQVKELLRQIEIDWKVNPTAKEYEILVNYTSKGRTLCIIYSTMLCNALVCFIMTSMISPILDIILPHNGTRVRSLAYDLDYGIDVQTHWLWLWLHSSTTSTATVLNIIGPDLMYVTLTVHSCCLFAIVRHKLEHVADSIKKHIMQSLENHNYNVECYVKYEDRQLRLKEQAAVMRECVINHQRAIHCVQLLHCIYTWCFLVILGLNLIIISISAVQLVSRLAPFQWDGMATCVMFICGQLIHLFFLSLLAQYLLDQSSNVHESTYSCFWYNMPVQIQKDIVLILIRSRIPCKLMAGKLFVMSLENFCTILQTSMSYFTVLASFR
ncbi:odorant receptor 13a-like, partial [Temnothorax curvispinosus]|uniref:Odorant receptor 13a-like n=1 Tax=Temnothorax curvispinosus TaxID=300111 RepID=A0A6J1QA25_9HYME